MNKEVIQNIKDNYKYLEKSIVNQLNLKVDNHYLTAGYNRERIWLDLFRQVIPMKFAIQQGVFLIDSDRGVSKEVDIAVFDEQFTPYIFNYGNIKFIPIEAVAVAIQCKSRSINENNLNEWFKEIEKLKAVTGGIARMATAIASFPNGLTTQQVTTPIKVLCHLKEEEVQNDNFDLIIAVKDDALEVKWNKSVDTLEKWFLKLNGVKDSSRIKGIECLKKNISELSIPDNPILSLVFQLNQLLMLINNPMLFPHQAYVDGFNEKNKV